MRHTKTFKAYRKMKPLASLGVVPLRERRFGTVADAFSHDSAYWGVKHEWYVVAARQRDSDSLSRSNFTVLLELLGGESDNVAIERASHWAVGWVEYLIVNPENHAGLREAIYAHSALYDYPVLDDDHWSELEYNEGMELAEGELSKYGEIWWEVFREVHDGGYGEDEIWSGIEAAREKLEIIAPLYANHASSPIDPWQIPLF